GLQQARPEDDVGYVAFEEADRVRTGERRAAQRPSADRGSPPSASARGQTLPPVSSFNGGSCDGDDSERRRRGEQWMSFLMLALVAVAIAVAIILLLYPLLRESGPVLQSPLRR